MLTLALPLLLTLAPVQEPVRTAAVDPLVALTPSNATIVVRFGSVDRFVAAFDPIDAAVTGEDTRTPGAEALSDILSMSIEHLHADRPLLMTLSLESGAPIPTYVLPVRDLDAFRTELAPMLGDVELARSGDYVGFSPVGPYEAGGSTLPVGLVDAAVSVRVDMETVVEIYGPLIEMGLDQMEVELGNLPPQPGVAIDFGELAELYADMFLGMIDSVHTADMSLDVEGGRLAAGMDLRTFEDSPMADWASETRVSYDGALGRVAGGAMEVVMAFEYDELMTRMEPWMDFAFSAYPDDMRATMESMLDSYADLASRMGPVTSMSMGFSGGVKMGYAMQFEGDGDELVTGFLASLDGVAGDDTFDLQTLPPVEIGGLELQRRRIEMDIDALMAGAGLEGEHVRAMYAQLYGEAMVYALGHSGGTLMLHVGTEGPVGDAGLEAAVATFLDPGAPDPEIARAAASLGAVSPAFIARYDFARLMNDMSFMMGAGAPEGFEMPELEGPLPVLMYGAVTAKSWRGRMEIGLAGLEELVDAMR